MRTSGVVRLVLATIVIAACGWVAPSAASAQAGQVGHAVGATQAAGTAGALPVGTRLTWQAGDSATQGTTLAPDANGWIWRDNQWWVPRSSGGSGGVGITEMTVIASDGNTLVGDVRRYLNDLQFNSPVIGGYDVVVGDSSGLPGFWVNPALLATLQPGFDGATRITRGQRNFNGQNLEVVSVSTTGSGSYSSQVYDAGSGVLLFGGTMAAAPGVVLTDQSGNLIDSATGAVTYSHQLFAGAREVAVPWAGTASPDWVRPGSSFSYDVYAVADIAGGSPLSSLAGRTTHVLDQAAGTAFVGRQLDEGFNSTGVTTTSSATRAYGGATFDGLWIPPAVFGQLQQQQVLDQDPFTGRTVMFGGVFDSVAVIATFAQIEQLEQYYDTTSGLLVMTRHTVDRGSIGTTTTEFRFTGQQ